MRRSLLLGLAFLFAGGLSCYDARTPLGPDAHDWRQVTTASECGLVTEAQIRALADEAFETAPSPSAVQGQLNSVFSASSQEGAQTQAVKVMEFILKQFRDHHGSLASEEKFAEFTNALMCYVGLELNADNIDDIVVVYPNTGTQKFSNKAGTAGFTVPPNGAPEMQIVTITELDFEQFASSINTKLDLHARLIRLLRTSTAEFFPHVTIWVCPTADVPAEVRDFLMLGHQHLGTFKILPEPEDPSEVPEECPEAVVAPNQQSSRSKTQVVAKDLVAFNGRTGPVSGSGATFSEVVPTDPRTRTGASGSGATFDPMNWGVLLNPVATACAEEYPAGSDIPANCRPTLTLTTPAGTPLLNVPVNFAVTAGTNGAVARALPGEAPGADCGPHGASAEVPTGTPDGDATACWRLGTTVNEVNRVRGTPAHGGDASDPFIVFGEFVNDEWVEKDFWEWQLTATDAAPEFTFNGFFPPVKNPPALNVVKAGSTVPVKFSLGGDFGLDIFAAGYPTSTEISCSDLGTAQASALATITTGGSALSYNGPADQYNYNWKSEKNWAGTCRTFTVKFTDDVEKEALFQFTK